MLKIQRYGWRPDLPDHRDHKFAIARGDALPPLVDLEADFPPVYDQGQLGSCTANGIAAAIDYERGQQGLPFVSPSRLFIYYGERDLEGTAAEDAGAFVRDGFKFVARAGAPPESAWPYDIGRFAVRPDDAAWSAALSDRVISYARAPQNALRSILAEGYPVVFGFSVYESFEGADVAATGIVPMPGPSEPMVGGHCVVLAGYVDDGATIGLPPGGHFKCRNSWGAGWGRAGYFYLPDDYVTSPDLADDFWTVRLTTPQEDI